MTQTPTRHERYHEDHQALAAASPGPAWLDDLRAAGWERFEALGFPTARRGNERWKYTAVAPIARVNFAYPLINGERTAGTEQTFGYSPIFAASSSNKEDEDDISQHLGSLAPMHDDGFTALNTAFLRDVAVVRVPDGSDEPVAVCVNHAGFGDLDGEQRFARHPRTLILAGRNTSLTVVEVYTGPVGPPLLHQRRNRNRGG